MRYQTLPTFTLGPAEALIAMQISLERVPNRTRAVRGIERARSSSSTHLQPSQSND